MQVDPRGQRFAAAFTPVVLAIVVTTGNAWLTAAPWLGTGATALVLFAAFRNAAFGFRLGCEMYPMLRRLPVPGRAG